MGHCAHCAHCMYIIRKVYVEMCLHGCYYVYRPKRQGSGSEDSSSQSSCVAYDQQLLLQNSTNSDEHTSGLSRNDPGILNCVQQDRECTRYLEDGEAEMEEEEEEGEKEGDVHGVEERATTWLSWLCETQSLQNLKLFLT